MLWRRESLDQQRTINNVICLKVKSILHRFEVILHLVDKFLSENLLKQDSDSTYPDFVKAIHRSVVIVICLVNLIYRFAALNHLSVGVLMCTKDSLLRSDETLICMDELLLYSAEISVHSIKFSVRSRKVSV